MKTATDPVNSQDPTQSKPATPPPAQEPQDDDDDDHIVQIDTLPDIWEELIWDFEKYASDEEWDSFKLHVESFEDSCATVLALAKEGQFTGRELAVELLEGTWGDEYEVVLCGEVTVRDALQMLQRVELQVRKTIQAIIAKYPEEFHDWEYPTFTSADIQDRKLERAEAIRQRQKRITETETGVANSRVPLSVAGIHSPTLEEYRTNPELARAIGLRIEPPQPVQSSGQVATAHSVAPSKPAKVMPIVINHDPSLAKSKDLFEACYKSGPSWSFPVYGKSLFESEAYQDLKLASVTLLFEVLDEVNYQVRKHGAEHVVKNGFEFGPAKVRSRSVSQEDFKVGIQQLVKKGFLGVVVSMVNGSKQVRYYPSNVWQKGKSATKPGGNPGNN